MEDPALTKIRAARPNDIDALSALLARAFADDPVFDWCLRPWSRRRAAEQFFAPLIADAMPHGGVRVDDAGTACAVWLPPDVPDSSSGVWAAWKYYLRMLRVASPLRIAHLKSVIHLSKEVHPPEPCYYLMFIGSLPDIRGSGRAAALIKDMLAAADGAGMPAFLETANATNISYYERFGFNVTGRAQLPRGGPAINLMWRRARLD